MESPIVERKFPTRFAPAATQSLDDAFGPGRADDILAAIYDVLTEIRDTNQKIFDELRRQGEDFE